MIDYIRKNRFLVSRRLLQIGLLILFGGANWFGWKVLTGNYSSANFLGKFFLTDPHAVLQSLAAGFVMGTNAIAGAMIIFTFYALIAGKSFCSWVCPLNLITDFTFWLCKKTGFEGNKDLLRFNRNTRYWVLGLGIGLSAIMGFAVFEVINPITLLQRGLIFGFGMGWIFVTAVFLFDMLVKQNGWCGHLCPLGALYSLSSRYSLIKVKHIADKCTLCMICKDVCHERQVLKFIGHHSGWIESECSNCGRCIEVCEDGALKYSVNIKSGDKNHE